MSLASPRPRGRSAAARAAALIGVPVFLLAAAGAVHAANIFALADDSQIVVYGVVRGVQGYKDGAFQVFTIEPERVLKGPATAGTPLRLVQDIIFPTDRPYFAPGARTLVFGVPLPAYSSYREALPSDTYWSWTEKKKTAAELMTLADPALVDPLVSYLDARVDPAATARLMAALLVSPSPRVRADALALLAARPPLARSIDADALVPFEAALGRDEPPVTDKALILVHLGRLGAPGIGSIAERLAAQKGPLRAAALDALVALDRLPDEAAMLAMSRSDDPALRIAAVRGLVRRPTRAALDRVEEILKKDPSSAVQIAALDALGGSSGDRQVALLTAGFRGDQAHMKAAANALSSLATPAAITALGETVAHGSYDAQVAAALALAGTHKPQATEVLRTLLDSTSDARVRKLIEIALGRMPDEHAE
jgi:HEAT repeat protein